MHHFSFWRVHCFAIKPLDHVPLRVIYSDLTQIFSEANYGSSYLENLEIFSKSALLGCFNSMVEFVDALPICLNFKGDM